MVGATHELRVLREGAGRVARLGGDPSTATCREDRLVHHQLQGARGRVDPDPVALLDQRDRSADERLRRDAWVAPEPRYTKGALAKYAKLVGGAEHGAITG